MAAFFGADGPGTAEIAWLGFRIVVGPFAKHSPDGMNRRQVDDVEAHLRDVGQPFLAIGECAVRSRLSALWSGEKIRTRS